MVFIRILLSLIFTSLLSSFTYGDEYDYGRMAHAIMNTYSEHLKKTKNFRLAGSGGSMAAELKVLNLMYFCNKELDLSQARRLYVEVVEGLLKVVNNTKEIRPYLHDYPFTSKNVKIQLGFFGNDGKGVKNKKIACIILTKKGNIDYAICKGNTEDWEDFYHEPYEEALRIVQQENAKSQLRVH